MSFSDDIRKALWTVAPFSTDYSDAELKAAANLVGSLYDLQAKTGAAEVQAAAHQAAAEREAAAREKVADLTARSQLEAEQIRGQALRDIHWPTTQEGSQYLAKKRDELALLGGSGKPGTGLSLLHPAGYLLALMQTTWGTPNPETGEVTIPKYAYEYYLRNLPKVKSLDDAQKVWMESQKELQPYKRSEELSSPNIRQQMYTNYLTATKLGLAPAIPKAEDYFLRGTITPQNYGAYEKWLNWKPTQPPKTLPGYKGTRDTEDQDLFRMIPG